MTPQYSLFLIPFLLLSVVAEISDETKVREAMQQAILNLSRLNPPTTNRFIDSQRANAASIAAQRKGDFYQETTRILVHKYGAEIIPRLSSLNTERIYQSIIG